MPRFQDKCVLHFMLKFKTATPNMLKFKTVTQNGGRTLL